MYVFVNMMYAIKQCLFFFLSFRFQRTLALSLTLVVLAPGSASTGLFVWWLGWDVVDTG